MIVAGEDTPESYLKDKSPDDLSGSQQQNRGLGLRWGCDSCVASVGLSFTRFIADQATLQCRRLAFSANCCARNRVVPSYVKSLLIISSLNAQDMYIRDIIWKANCS